jgi:carboxymethylenebutenolidase
VARSKQTSADPDENGGGSDERRLRRTQMKDRISMEARDSTFNAYIVRPKTLSASTVVVLQELFGVNADIRKTCDELAEQGFVAVAPDLFWRQDPGVEFAILTG